MRLMSLAKGFLNRLTAKPSTVQSMRPPYVFSQAGVTITPDEALTIVVIMRCVMYLSNTLASVPINVRRQMGENASVKVFRHPVDVVYNHSANEEMTGFQFRQAMWLSALVYSSGYAEIEHDRAGRVIALHYLTYDRVSIERDRDTNALQYRVTGYGQGPEAILPANKMLHYRLNSGYDGIVPYSIVAYAAKSLGVSIALENFASSFFGNGAYPGGILQHPKKLSKTARDRLTQAWYDMVGGSTRAKKTMVLEEGVTWASMELENDKSQFLESRKHQVLECCRVMGVPPNKVYDWSNATYDKLEQANREFVTDTLLPYSVAIEQESDFKLLNRNYGGLFCKYDFTTLLRGSVEDRASYYDKLAKLGVLSINEIREMEGRNPIPNGDVHLVAANNMASLDDVISGKVRESKAPAPAPEPTEEEEEADPAEALANTRFLNLLSDDLEAQIERMAQEEPEEVTT